jgi:hypothetical protein
MGALANLNAVRHGATSEARIRPVAANHRRRVLRQLRLSARDLDSVGRGYLDLYVRAVAKVELLDRFFEANGFLDEKGEPRGGVKVYFVAVNSSRLALARLEEHVRQRGLGEGLDALIADGRRARLAADQPEAS